MADNAITLQGLSAITRFIGRSTFQTQDQHLVLGWFVITTNHPLKSWAVWLFPGTSLEKEAPRVCPLERDDSSGHLAGSIVRAGGRFLGRKTPKSPATQSFCHGRFSDSGATKVGLGDLAPKWSKLHATTRFWALASRATRTRFFDVLTARVFQEKKP
mgnify:CR=1 FL=1|tara:strand:+ start:95 stop:568 length:474 start_codon:yes stop_codon:yes gene_type:complete